MFPQHDMIARLRELCLHDPRLIAACLYGSFATGEADRFSDVECALFFEPEALAGLDRCAWVAQLGPVSLFFADDFGHYTAIFENLIRGEFHFEPAQNLPTVAGWRGNAWFPSLEAALLVDRTGELARNLRELVGAPPVRETRDTAQRLIANLTNLILFGSQTLGRGEHARALELLSLCHRYLQKLARLAEGSTVHWPTPSRLLERDLSPESYARLVACTARLERGELIQAYRAAWAWGIELTRVLAGRFGADAGHGEGLALPPALHERITTQLDALAASFT